MSALKEATVKSRTNWINLAVTLIGAGLVIFQDVIAQLPELSQVPDGSTAPAAVGATAITVAVINAVLRYMTQLKHEKQLNDR